MSKYAHRNGEAELPYWHGHYWVKVRRMEDWSTSEYIEIWERATGRWIDFNAEHSGIFLDILAIYGPIPNPFTQEPTK